MIISLIGFMAAGKSTLGAVLAKSMNAQFIDLDAYIEEKEGKSISDIFEKEGESTFRRLEENYLEDILEDHISSHPDAIADLVSVTTQAPSPEALPSRNCTLVLSLGGGCVTSNICAELISRFTYCIYLKADIETILKRVAGSDTQRPLLKESLDLRETISRLYAERGPLYEKLARKTIAG